MSLTDYFNDLRFGRDRRRQAKLILLALFLLTVLGALLYWQQRRMETQVIRTPNVVTPVFPTEEERQEAPTVVDHAAPTPTAPVSAAAPPPPGEEESPQKRTEKALHAYVDGNIEEARRLLAGINLERTKSSMAWELAGLIEAASGNPQAAEDKYDLGLALAPSAGLYYRKFLIAREKGNYDQALKSIENAAELAPRDVVVSNERLLLLIQMGRKEQVRTEITTPLSAGIKTDKRAWIFALAGLALEQGDTSEAAKMLAFGQKALDEAAFRQILNNPVLARYQNDPKIFPFYLVSTKPK